jgi:hypothetical protein
MQETIESIRFNRNPLQDEEDKQKRLSEQRQENNNDRVLQTGDSKLNPNLTSPEELQIKNQRSSEQQNSEQNSILQPPIVENFDDEEERERNNTFIQRAKQNLAVTDFFLFFLGSFLLIYILLYIYVF